MPTPDASQFTRLKKYAAIDSRPDTGVKVFTHLYQPVPSVRQPIDFLASFSNKVVSPCNFVPINSPLGNANGNKLASIPSPTISNMVSTIEIGGESTVITWAETGATTRSVTCTLVASPYTAVPSAISGLAYGSCTITNQVGTPGPYTVTVTVTNSGGNATASINANIPLPTISNLAILIGGGGGLTAVLGWTETNTTSRSATCVVTSSPSTSVPGAISGLAAGACTITNQITQGPYTVTITVTNSQGSTSSSINVSVGCFLGFVKVKTLDGPVAVEDIVVGTKILQPSGRYSNVVELKRMTVTDLFAEGDGRLYADSEEKMVVTYWHKVRFSDETEEVKAGDHPRLHQVFRPTPFDVFHIKLEDPINDKVLIYDTDITAEGFNPNQSW